MFPLLYPNVADYEDVFRNDSIVILSQAGNYSGPEAIIEYIGFSNTDSPFIGFFDILEAKTRFLFRGLEPETGECIFTVGATVDSHSDPLYTARKYKFTYSVGAKLYFNPEEAYVTRAYFWFPSTVNDFFFHNLTNTDVYRGVMCDTMSNDCAFDIGDRSSCIDRLAALPLTDGPDYFLDTNSQGCRVLHTTMALSRPEIHCPHISLAPMEDLDGKIKCQDPGAGFAIEDFFDSEDLEWLNKYVRRRGIDPDVGIVFCEDSFQCRWRDRLRDWGFDMMGLG